MQKQMETTITGYIFRLYRFREKSKWKLLPVGQILGLDRVWGVGFRVQGMEKKMANIVDR